MSEKSAIEWTDATWNPVRGCTKVSPGCKHCFAETFAERWRGIPGHPYEQGFDVRLVPEALELPLRWRAPRRVFVNSMSDLFHEAVPDYFIERVWAVMLICARREVGAHTFQVLTKRAARMLDFFAPSDERLVRVARAAGSIMEDGDAWHDEILFSNASLAHPRIWLGVSVENQAAADERIPHLLATPAAIRFLSCEPLLGPVDPRRLLVADPPVADWGQALDALGGRTSWQGGSASVPRVDWVIVGGESGPGARPCWVPDVRALVRSCRAAGVPAFVKQLGANVQDRNDAGWDGCEPDEWPEQLVAEDRIEHLEEGYQGAPVRVHLRDRKGGDMREWPEDLRVREFPAVRSTTR